MKNNISSYWTIIFGLVFMITIIMTCNQREYPTEGEEISIIKIDSFEISPVDLEDLQRIAFDSSKSDSYLRSARTIILSSQFTLNVFTTLDYYFSRNNLKDDMVYTAVVTPIQGNVDLSVRSYLPGRANPYRMIRHNYKDGVEILSLTKKDLLPQERELNFVVKGPLGSKFKWDIYAESIPPLEENIGPIDPTCTCGQILRQTLLCENFENKVNGGINDQAPYFMSFTNAPAIEAMVVSGQTMGYQSKKALQLKKLKQVPSGTSNTQAVVDLNNESEGKFSFSFFVSIPKDGVAEFEAPGKGGQFRLNANGTGSIKVADNKVLQLKFRSNDWIRVKCDYEPALGFYRAQIHNKGYSWEIKNQEAVLDYFKFYGTTSGYKIDDICYTQLNESEQ